MRCRFVLVHGLGNGRVARVRHAPVLVKLTGVALVAVLGVAVLAAFRLSSIRPDEMESRQTKIRNLVESAQSVVAGFQQREADGELSRGQAQEAAKAALRVMRYDQKEYFWINDMTPRMVMHPIKPELEGKDLSAIVDQDGKHLFNEFVATVKADGAGYVDYLWPKPGHKDPVPKLSYVSGFAPWGWVIGTGIYVDDVDAIVAERRTEVIVETGLILLVLVAGMVLVSLSISRPLGRLAAATRRLAAGELDIVLPPEGRSEIGRMSAAMSVLRSSLATKLTLERENAELQARTEADKRRAAAELARRLQEAVFTVLDRITESIAALHGVSSDLAGTTDHLADSVRDITGRADVSTAAAAKAAEEAADASGTVNGLTSAAETIGGVIEVIRKVAEQTNLLALNATIEAARAGELGKGFAVVASEVKELAQQSAHATDRIATEIEAIQNTSAVAAEVMGRMAETVQTLGTATQEVAVAIAGNGNGDDTSVRRSAEATGQVSRRIQEASENLNGDAERLRTEFDALLRQLTEQ
jgi:methyl-accepting chemotaxis protein